MLYPATFGGCWFFDECSKEKNHCTAGESGGTVRDSKTVFCLQNSSGSGTDVQLFQL